MQNGFYFNADLCIGCKACAMACKDTHDSPAGIAFRRVCQMVKGEWKEENGVPIPVDVSSYSMSLSCNHCEHPACLAACPKEAIYKDETGAVRIAYDRCVACKVCIRECLYGAISFNYRKNRPEKCDLCRSQGGIPACVSACPMRCLEVLPLEELEQLSKNDPDVERITDTGNTGPVVFVRRNHNQTANGNEWIRSMKEEW